jgi:sugar O-acyltransferase (sialic acid O-acetyltransferase NeuD family)
LSVDVLVVGAGGHGQVIADVLWRAWERGGAERPLGFVDDDPALWGRKLVDVPVLGPIADLASIAHDGVVVAIGDNRVRQRVFDELARRGEYFIVAKHPSAVVAPDVRIGRGTMLCAGAIVSVGSVIGDNVILNTGSSIDHHSHIGKHAHVAPGVRMGGAVTVDEGAFIGLAASVLPGNTIGAWSVVGAGACVAQSVAPGVTVVGVPAREVSHDRG